MDELIKKLEQAEHGSRELDALIWAERDGRRVKQDGRKLFAQSRQSPYDLCILGEWFGTNFETSCFHKPDLPHYTSSLDAALTLWGDDWKWNVGSDGVVEFWNGCFGDETCEFSVQAKTPSLAVCLGRIKYDSALRAYQEAE